MLTQDAVDFCAQQTSPNTQQAYRFDLLTWYAFVGDRNPTREIAIEYRTHLEERFAARTAARRFNTVRAYYRWAGRYNPLDGIKSPKRLRNATPRIPNDRVVGLIIEHAELQRDRAVVALLLNGLRASEVTALSPDDFIWSPEYGCHIIRVIGKGYKQRLVPANYETSREVSAYLSGAKRGVPWLLGSLRGNERMTRRQVTEVLRRACKRAGIPEVSPHKLRHHFGTRMWQNTKNLLGLQNLMGHESPVTTQVYVHLDLADVVDMMKHDPRNGKETGVEDYANQRAGAGNSHEGAGRAGQGIQGISSDEGYVQ